MDLKFSSEDDPSNCRSFSLLKRVKTFLTGIMNDCQPYIIDKKLNEIANLSDAERSLLRAVSHKQRIYLVFDFRNEAFAR